MAGPTPWNHNLHDHHLVLNEAAGCATALDAGCGDGLLARDLHWQVPDVTAPTCWPPPHSYTDVRRTVTAELPAARYRRLLFWRYCVQWRKPA